MDNHRGQMDPNVRVRQIPISVEPRETHRSEPESAPNIIDPTQVIPMPPPPSKLDHTPEIIGEIRKTPDPQPVQKEHSDGEELNPRLSIDQTQIISDRILAINLEVHALLDLVKNFGQLSAESKDFRYIEEMLTRCMLNLDQIECGHHQDLRQKRKSICRWVEQVSKILHKKLALNKELAELSNQLGSQ